MEVKLSKYDTIVLFVLFSSWVVAEQNKSNSIMENESKVINKPIESSQDPDVMIQKWQVSNHSTQPETPTGNNFIFDSRIGNHLLSHVSLNETKTLKKMVEIAGEIHDALGDSSKTTLNKSINTAMSLNGTKALKKMVEIAGEIHDALGDSSKSTLDKSINTANILQKKDDENIDNLRIMVDEKTKESISSKIAQWFRKWLTGSLMPTL